MRRCIYDREQGTTLVPSDLPVVIHSVQIVRACEPQHSHLDQCHSSVVIFVMIPNAAMTLTYDSLSAIAAVSRLSYT